MKILNGTLNNKINKIAFMTAVLLAPGFASAASITDSLLARPGYVPSNPLDTTWDGEPLSLADGFSVLSPFVDGNYYELSSFNALQGDKIEVFSLMEMALFTNVVGVKDDQGNFHEILESKNGVPNSGSFTVGSDTELTFALLSPLGLMSTIDAENYAGETQALAQVVTQPGTLTIQRTVLDPANESGPYTFNLLAGDIILFFEDIPLSASDFDYNDMVTVVRHTAAEIPEPTTVLLFGAGLAGLATRKKAQAKKDAELAQA